MNHHFVLAAAQSMRKSGRLVEAAQVLEEAVRDARGSSGSSGAVLELLSELVKVVSLLRWQQLEVDIAQSERARLVEKDLGAALVEMGDVPADHRAEVLGLIADCAGAHQRYRDAVESYLEALDAANAAWGAESERSVWIRWHLSECLIEVDAAAALGHARVNHEIVCSDPRLQPNYLFPSAFALAKALAATGNAHLARTLLLDTVESARTWAPASALKEAERLLDALGGDVDALP